MLSEIPGGLETVPVLPAEFNILLRQFLYAFLCLLVCHDHRYPGYVTALEIYGGRDDSEDLPGRS